MIYSSIGPCPCPCLCPCVYSGQCLYQCVPVIVSVPDRTHVSVCEHGHVPVCVSVHVPVSVRVHGHRYGHGHEREN